jgi:hypothetical protein
MHKRSLRISQQLVDNRFWIFSIRDLGIDHVVVCIVSAKRATIAKIGRIFVSCAVTLAFLGVNKNRSNLGIRMTGRNRNLGK